jgi:hypothetical protein
MIKNSAFPIIIDLELHTDSEWVVVQTYLCTNIHSLYSKMTQIKSLYVLKDKDYRIMLTLQSKVNAIMD